MSRGEVRVAAFNVAGGAASIVMVLLLRSYAAPNWAQFAFGVSIGITIMSVGWRQ